MSLNAMTSMWARTGLIWFLATMTFGMYLGITSQFTASSPHAHLGLLGWLSSIAFAFLWSIADPENQTVWPARLHWAVHNLGLIVLVWGMWMVIRTGEEMYGGIIGLGGLTIILATLWLIFLLWPRLRTR